MRTTPETTEALSPDLRRLWDEVALRTYLQCQVLWGQEPKTEEPLRRSFASADAFMAAYRQRWPDAE